VKLERLENILFEVTRCIDRELQSEGHLVAEIYHQLRNKSNLHPEEVVLEAPYTSNPRKKCDMLIKLVNDHEVWIEVKGYFSSETSSTRSRKHTGKQSSPRHACRKLLTLGSETVKVLVVYQNCVYTPRDKNSWSALEELCRLKQIMLIHMQFKNLNVSKRH
jgi:hypothetical protein